MGQVQGRDCDVALVETSNRQMKKRHATFGTFSVGFYILLLLILFLFGVFRMTFNSTQLVSV